MNFGFYAPTIEAQAKRITELEAALLEWKRYVESAGLEPPSVLKARYERTCAALGVSPVHCRRRSRRNPMVEPSDSERATWSSETRAYVEALEAHASALERFKSFVHRRLDEAGVEKDPNGPHTLAGCRIGDRLDIALGPAKVEGATE